MTKHKLGVICNHEGDYDNAGHYTTFAWGIESGEEQWYKSNDEWVTKVEKKDVTNKKSREESYCFVYYKESLRPDVDVLVSHTEKVPDNDFDNPQPGPSTANIPSKGKFFLFYCFLKLNLIKFKTFQVGKMLLSKACRVKSLHPEIILRKHLQHLSLLVWINLQQRKQQRGEGKEIARKIKLKQLVFLLTLHINLA